MESSLSDSKVTKWAALGIAWPLWTPIVVGIFTVMAFWHDSSVSSLKDSLEYQKELVKSYEKSGEWNLPETLEALGSASALLREQLDSINDYQELKKQVALDAGTIGELVKKVEALKNRNGELQKVVQKVRAQSVITTVKEGTSESIRGGALTLAVTVVSGFPLRARLKVFDDNGLQQVAETQYTDGMWSEPGLVFEHEYADMNCRLVVEKIDSTFNYVTFNSMCFSKN